MKDDFKISSERNDRGVTVSVLGDVDAHSSPRLREHLMDTMDRLSRGSRLVLEIAHGSFVCSDFLGILVATLKRCRAKGVALALATPHNSRTRSVLEITGLEKVFPPFGTAAEALDQPLILPEAAAA